MVVTVITGANSGIGYAAAQELAARHHEVLMICRNKTKGKQAQEKIIGKSSNNHVSLYVADLADLSSIQTVAKQIIAEHDVIDNLLNNAGLMLLNHDLTDIGLEKTLAVNHLGHFLLTDLLLPLLKNSENPRIINTSSAAHRRGSFNFNNINYQNSSYHAFSAYGRSKLANILFTKSLNRLFQTSELSYIHSYAIHPGFVGSNFAKNNGLLASIAMNILSPFNKSPQRGAQPLIYLVTASGQELEGLSGEYFVDTSPPFTKPKIIPKRTIAISYDEQLQDKLWEKSRDWIHLWNHDYIFNFDSVSHTINNTIN